MDIEPGNCITNLGAWFDSMLSMETHINKVCSSAFYYLHNLRRIRKYLSQDCLVTLIHAFVTGQLDYYNSLMYGLMQCQISKLQRIRNAATRIALDLSKFCHIIPALQQLHWLPVVKRIQFKILLLTFKVFTVSLHATSVNLYLSNPNLPTISAQTTVLCCYLLHRKCCLHLVLTPLLLLPLRFGTNCLLILEMLLP